MGVLGMGKFNEVTITIPSWDKFNARKDITRPHWFRMDHSIFEDPKFYNLEPADWAVLLYLLCQKSKSGEGFQVNYAHAQRVAGLSSRVVDSAIEKLLQSQFITVSNTAAAADVTFPAGDERIRPDPSNTNKQTNNTDSTCAFAPERLREIWNQNRGILSECIKLTPSRLAAARKRIEENGDPEYWADIVRTIASDPFFQGRNERKWRATFDYLLRPDTHIRIAERRLSNPKLALIEKAMSEL